MSTKPKTKRGRGRPPKQKSVAPTPVAFVAEVEPEQEPAAAPDGEAPAPVERDDETEGDTKAGRPAAIPPPPAAEHVPAGPRTAGARKDLGDMDDTYAAAKRWKEDGERIRARHLELHPKAEAGPVLSFLETPKLRDEPYMPGWMIAAFFAYLYAKARTIAQIERELTPDQAAERQRTFGELGNKWAQASRHWGVALDPKHQDLAAAIGATLAVFVTIPAELFFAKVFGLKPPSEKLLVGGKTEEVTT